MAVNGNLPSPRQPRKIWVGSGCCLMTLPCCELFCCLPASVSLVGTGLGGGAGVSDGGQRTGGTQPSSEGAACRIIPRSPPLLRLSCRVLPPGPRGVWPPHTAFVSFSSRKYRHKGVFSWRTIQVCVFNRQLYNSYWGEGASKGLFSAGFMLTMHCHEPALVWTHPGYGLNSLRPQTS